MMTLGPRGPSTPNRRYQPQTRITIPNVDSLRVLYLGALDPQGHNLATTHPPHPITVIYRILIEGIMQPQLHYC